jgi:hypothetical protein
MDLFDQKLWKDGMEIVMNNLHIVGPLTGAAAVAGWWLKSSQDKGIIRELRERIKTFEGVIVERRQLSDEKEQFVGRKNAELAAQVESLKSQLSAGASTGTISTTVKSIDSTVSEISLANNEISVANTELSKALQPVDSDQIRPLGSAKPIGAKQYEGGAPPNLAFTKVLSAEVSGKVLPKPVATWNGLLNEVIMQAAEKIKNPEALRDLLMANSVMGKKEDQGYRYLVPAGISVQGQDAKSAWRATYHLASNIRIPIKVVFSWYDNEKAEFPGETGKFEVTEVN